MKLVYTANRQAYLHQDVWDLLDTMGPDNSTYHGEGGYVVFSGHSQSEAASWLFRIASQAKTEILTLFLQDVPDRASMTLLARLMCDLEAYLGGFEGSLFLYWLEGIPNHKMTSHPDATAMVTQLDVAMHRKKDAHRKLMETLASSVSSSPSLAAF